MESPKVASYRVRRRRRGRSEVPAIGVSAARKKKKQKAAGSARTTPTSTSPPVVILADCEGRVATLRTADGGRRVATVDATTLPRALRLQFLSRLSHFDFDDEEDEFLCLTFQEFIYGFSFILFVSHMISVYSSNIFRHNFVTPGAENDLNASYLYYCMEIALILALVLTVLGMRLQEKVVILTGGIAVGALGFGLCVINCILAEKMLTADNKGGGGKGFFLVDPGGVDSPATTTETTNTTKASKKPRGPKLTLQDCLTPACMIPSGKFGAAHFLFAFVIIDVALTLSLAIICILYFRTFKDQQQHHQ